MTPSTFTRSIHVLMSSAIAPATHPHSQHNIGPPTVLQRSRFSQPKKEWCHRQRLLSFAQKYRRRILIHTMPCHGCHVLLGLPAFACCKWQPTLNPRYFHFSPSVPQCFCSPQTLTQIQRHRIAILWMVFCFFASCRAAMFYLCVTGVKSTGV